MTPPGLSPHYVSMAWGLLALGVMGLFVMILLLARTVAKAANRKRTWVFSHLRETELDRSADSGKPVPDARFWMAPDTIYAEEDESKRERYRC